MDTETTLNWISRTNQRGDKELRYMGRELKKKKSRNKEGLNPREQAAVRRCSLSLLNSQPYGRHLSVVLEVIFIAAFIAWQARTAPMRECLPTCQCKAIQLMERNKHE